MFSGMVRGLRHDLLSGDLAIRVREAVERAWQGIADTVEEDGTIRNIIGGKYDHHCLLKTHLESTLNQEQASRTQRRATHPPALSTATPARGWVQSS